jgi:hypothetical protein
MFVMICANFATSQVLALSIEDENMAAMSNIVSSSVYNDKSFAPFVDYSCKIVGEKIQLSETPAATTYFLTTADACGWGAALGPIWLVRTVGGKASVVLSTGGYSVDILKEIKRTMHNVKIANATAARSSSVIYEFNGIDYERLDKKH